MVHISTCIALWIITVNLNIIIGVSLILEGKILQVLTCVHKNLCGKWINDESIMCLQKITC